MPVTSVLLDHHVVIRIEGHFGFNDYRAFREAFSRPCSGAPRFRVELERVESADSAALAMLLLLLDRVDGDPSRVVLSGPCGQFGRMLHYSGIGRRFALAG